MPDFITRDEFNDTMDQLTSTMREVAIRLRGLEVLEHIPLGGGGGGAPADAEYVTLALNAFLTAERVLTAGDGIAITDAGANSTVTIETTCGWHPQATVIAVGEEQTIGATCQVTIAHSLQNDGSLINNGELIIWEPGGISPPAGLDMEVQLNVGGVLGTDSEFYYDYTNDRLWVGGRFVGGDLATSTATGTNAFAWGSNCDATSDYSVVGGGENNIASAESCTVSGGAGNTASDLNATVGGGRVNTASGQRATVSGGDSNTATAIYSTVGGGISCDATAAYATVGGGNGCDATGIGSTIGGGQGNDASGDYSIVPGGLLNDAAGDYSWAGGRRAHTGANNGVFIWADQTNADFTADRADQAKFRVTGGFHIEQPSTTGAQPVLTLDQSDIDIVLAKIIGTAAAASADRTLVADSDYGTPGALVGWIQIEIQDDGNRIADGDYYIPFYAVPT